MHPKISGLTKRLLPLCKNGVINHKRYTGGAGYALSFLAGLLAGNICACEAVKGKQPTGGGYAMYLLYAPYLSCKAA